MRAILGFTAIHAVFATAGMAVLYALGLVARVRDVPAAVGAAYLTGVAAVMPVLILLLVAGGGAKLPQLVAVSALVAVAGGAAGFVRARRGAVAIDEPPAARGPAEAWLVRAGVLALGLFAVIGASAFRRLPTVGDDWTIWSYKAVALFQFDGKLQPEVFIGPEPGPAHRDYPILQPLLESLYHRAMGGIHLQAIHVELWVLFIAFVWTAAYLLRTRGTPLAVVLPPIGALTLAQGPQIFVSIGYADVTVGSFIAAGVLGLGLAIERGRGDYALLGALFLAAGASTKNEGLVAAIVVLLAAVVVVLAGRVREWRREWPAAIAAPAIVGVAVAPWIVWRSSHDLRNNDLPPLADTLDWTFLTDRIDRLSMANGKFLEQLASLAHWAWGPAAFLAVAVACLVAGAARRPAAFYLASATLITFGIYWAYWVGNLAIGSWLFDSADRLATTVAFVALVGVAHLIALLVPWPRAAEADREAASRSG